MAELSEAPSSALSEDPSIASLSLAGGGGRSEAEKEAKKAAKAAAKAAKEAEKAAKASMRGVKQAAMTQPEEDDPVKNSYGDLEMVQSKTCGTKTYARVEDLSPAMEGQQVLIRSRVHNVRGKGKSAFLVLRQRTASVQAILFTDDVTVSKGMVKYASQITRESIVDVGGVVAVPAAAIEGCSQSQVELKVNYIKVVSRAVVLPFEITDAARSEEEIRAAEARGDKMATVSQDMRLDNRFLDLRTPANQAIFKCQSAVCQLFKEVLLGLGFQEIHSPKLIGGASEGGADVFTLDYKGMSACLAQSPQLYKQMAICADFERVFEIGPVFRAENSFTHRHLCEFIGLDLEMQIYEHYFEVMDVIEKLFEHIFNGLSTKYDKELAVIASQYPFEKPVFKPLRLTFPEGIKMLQDAGYRHENGAEIDPMGDLNTAAEKALGALVKEKYGTDFYILHRYPLTARPFYTMPCADDPRYSNSYDVFIRGEEIISGAQRIHCPDMLAERATSCGIPLETIQSYINSFKYGAAPHGGAGVGLERVVMLYCGLNNIRKTSLFPRDPKRLTP